MASKFSFSSPSLGSSAGSRRNHHELVVDQKDTSNDSKKSDSSKPTQKPTDPVDHDDKAAPPKELEDHPDEDDSSIQKATESVETAFIKTIVVLVGLQVLLAESQLQVKNVATLDWLETDKDL